MNHTRISAAAACVIAMLATAACGGDDQSQATTASRPAAQAAAEGYEAVSPNRAPIVEHVALTPAAPTANDRLRAQVKVSDPDGDRVAVTYTWWANGRKAGEGSSFDLSGVARGAKVEVSVVADDGRIESSPVTASVSLGNSAPKIEAIRFEPSGAWVANQSVAALPEAVDPDGDPLTFEYTWYLNGDQLFEDGPTIDGSTLKRGDAVELVVVASDGHAESDELRTQTIEVSNAAPEITSQPGAIGPDGVFRYQMRATDPDGDRAFMYRVVQSPPGAEMDVLDGKLTWQPDTSQSGAHGFELEVDDRMGGTATQKFTLTVHFDDAPPASMR